MSLPLPSQDKFSFCVNNTYSIGAATEDIRGPFQSDDQILTHSEPTMPWRDEQPSFNLPAFNIPLFQVFFEPSNQVTTEGIPAGQPAPSPSYVPSSPTSNMPVDVPDTAAAAPASTIAQPTPATGVATQGRFRCPLCPKMFDRLTRAEACHNKHLNWKRHMCHGVCGKVNCTAAYFSIENLHRYARVLAKRKVVCPYCSRSILRQNISRHKKYCL